MADTSIPIERRKSKWEPVFQVVSKMRSYSRAVEERNRRDRHRAMLLLLLLAFLLALSATAWLRH